jgi:hypothetical protein
LTCEEFPNAGFAGSLGQAVADRAGELAAVLQQRRPASLYAVPRHSAPFMPPRDEPSWLTIQRDILIYARREAMEQQSPLLWLVVFVAAVLTLVALWMRMRGSKVRPDLTDDQRE